MNPDGSLQISAMEAFPLDQISEERVNEGLKNAQQELAKLSTRPMDDVERVEEMIKVEVLTSLQHALKTRKS